MPDLAVNGSACVPDDASRGAFGHPDQRLVRAADLHGCACNSLYNPPQPALERMIRAHGVRTILVGGAA